MGGAVSRIGGDDQQQPLLHEERPVPVDESALDHSSLLALQKHKGSGAKVMKKIQPNIYLANERTFLNWTNLSLTFGAVGAAALAFGEKIIGFFIVVLGMMLCFRALLRFLHRLTALQSQSRLPDTWEDNIGPVLMTGGIVCAAAIMILQAFDTLASNA